MILVPTHYTTPIISPIMPTQRISQQPHCMAYSPKPSKRRIFLILLALSFVPYVLPEQKQPRWYHDGASVEDLEKFAKQRRINKFLGGNVQDINW